jgi:hypothetical protein
MAALKDIAALFLGIVGWRPSADDSSEDALPESLTKSDSGLFVQDATDLVTLDIIQHIKPPAETLEDYLTRITADTVTKVVTKVLSYQQVSLGKTLLENTPLVMGVGRVSETVVKQGRFVGFRLSIPQRTGVVTQLARLSVQLDTLQQEPLGIYVYRTGSPDVVDIIDVLPTRAGWPAWVTLSTPLDLSDLEPGEDLLIGYYEEDLTGYAVKRSWAPQPCYCVSDPYPLYSPHFAPQSISIPPSGLSADRSLPSLNAYRVEDAALGLNLDLRVICDATAALVLPKNRLALAEVIQLALASRILAGIVATTNITQLTAREDVQADAYALLTRFEAQLNGGKDNSTEKTYYSSLLQKVTLDTSSLDAVCLPKQESLLSMGQLRR